MATFGNTVEETTESKGWADYFVGGKFTLATALDITKITAWISNTNNAMYVRASLWSDSAGYPDALLGVTPAEAIAATFTKAAKDFTFSSAVSLTAADYWLFLHPDYAGSGFAFYVASSGGAFKYKSYDYSSGTPDPFPSGAGGTAWNMAIYATGEAPGGGAVRHNLMMMGIG